MEQQVNISSDTVPTYVVFESEDFWSSDAEVQVISYYKDEDRYEKYFRRDTNRKFPGRSE
jgi:hypothetical protein